MVGTEQRRSVILHLPLAHHADLPLWRFHLRCTAARAGGKEASLNQPQAAILATQRSEHRNAQAALMSAVVEKQGLLRQVTPAQDEMGALGRCLTRRLERWRRVQLRQVVALVGGPFPLP